MTRYINNVAHFLSSAVKESLKSPEIC